MGTRTDHPPRASFTSAGAGLITAVVAAGLLLWWGGGAVTEALPGLPWPGPVTPWALPAAKLGTQLGAVATVGLLLAAVVLSPRDQGRLSRSGYRRMLAAGWAALFWSACTAATVAFTISDLLARPVSATTPTSLLTFVLTVDAGSAYGLSFVLSVLVLIVCRVALKPSGAAVALALAVLAVVPPIFTGHAASSGDHQLAVSSLLLHVVPVTLWAGGLLALLMSGLRTADLAVAVRRFSPLAAYCLLAVGASGVLAAMIRVPSAADLVGTAYGRMVLLKTVTLVALAGIGLVHRRSAMPALRQGDRRRFARVAGVELVLFGLAVGTAVALSRTAAPGLADDEDLATSLLGFAMPGPLTAGRLLGDWLPDPLFIAASLTAVGLYLAGVRRLRRRGDAWAGSRVAAFLAGNAVIVLATSSGLARYGPVLFSVHMVQHLLLAMIAPILLALAAPLTLGLRALRPSSDPAWPGPREALLALLKLRLAGVLARPLVALGVYVAGMYVMYLSGLFELALRSHAAHLLMVAHFLGAGYLFFWLVIGVDPAPRPRPAPPLRILLVLIAMALHAFLGIAIMQSADLLAGDWFTALPRTWGASPAVDQRLAGGIAWSFGEIPAVVVIAVLVRQWIRADEREQRRVDRELDRQESKVTV